MRGVTAYKLGVAVDVKGDAAANSKLRSVDKSVGSLHKSFSGLGSADGVGALAGSLTGLTGIASAAAAGIAAAFTATIAVGAGLFALAKKASDFGSEIFDASQKVAFSAEALSALKVAAEESGTDLGAVTKGIVKFERAMVDAEAGNKKLASAFKQLGIDTTEGIRAPEAAFSKFISQFNQLENDAVKTAIATQLFGKSGADLKGTFETVGSSLDAYKAKMKALGITITDDAAIAADEFGDQLTELGLVADGVGRIFASEFMPAITGAMDDIATALAGNQETWREWGRGVAEYIQKVRGTWSAFKVWMASGRRLDFGTLQDFEFSQVQQEDRARSLASLGRRLTEGHRRAGIPGEGGGEGGGGGGADKAAQERVRQLEQQIKTSEKLYKSDTETAKREYKLHLISLRDFTAEVIRLENERFLSEQATLTSQLAFVKKKSEVDKINGEIDERRLERDRNILAATDEQNQKEFEASEAHEAELLKLLEDAGRNTIELQERLAEEGRISYEAAAQSELDTITAIFDRKLEVLARQEEAVGPDDELRQKINDQHRALTAAQLAFQNDHEIKMDEARRKDAESARVYFQTLTNLTTEWATNDRNIQLAQLDWSMEHDRMSVQQRAQNIAARARLRIQEVDAQTLLAKRELELELARVLSTEKNLERRATITARYLALIQQLEDDAERKGKEILAGANKESKANQSPFGARLSSGLFGVLGTNKDDFDKIGALGIAAQNSADMAVGALSSIGNALGEMVGQWVLMGDQADISMQKMAAAVLAGLATQAAAMAVFFTAMGVVSLTPWGAFLFGPPWPWFQGALLMAGIAVGAAGLGRLTAGNSGGGSTADQSTADQNAAFTDPNNAANQFNNSSDSRFVAGSSNAPLVGVLSELRDEVKRMKNFRAEDVIVMGAPKAYRAISDAAEKGLRSSGKAVNNQGRLLLPA